MRREIQALTKMAEERDAQVDVEFGPDFRGDEIAEEMQRRESRLRAIKEAKSRLEKRAAEEAAASTPPNPTKEKKSKAERTRKHPRGKPKPRNQKARKTSPTLTAGS